MFIASTSECAIIVDLYKRLRRTISIMGRMYAKTHEGQAAALKKAYAYGMNDTIYKRLVTIYKDTPDTRALVLVKKSAIQDKMQSLFGDLKHHKASPPTDKKAFMQGVEDGKQVNLHKSLQNKQTHIGTSV
jgi:hypothetical protein